MGNNASAAKAFTDACDGGKGWEGCKEYCSGDDAKFSLQGVGGLKDFTTIEQYCDFIVALNVACPDYKVEKIFEGYDEERKSGCMTAYFSGTHTKDLPPGFPAPTNKKVNASYVYVVRFDDNGKICEMTKVWNDAVSMAEFGWM